MNKILNWILASFEGADGKLSSKKASVFVFTLMVGFMVVATYKIYLVHPNATQPFADIIWITVTSGAIGFSITSAIQSIKQGK